MLSVIQFSIIVCSGFQFSQTSVITRRSSGNIICITDIGNPISSTREAICLADATDIGVSEYSSATILLGPLKSTHAGTNTAVQQYPSYLDSYIYASPYPSSP